MSDEEDFDDTLGDFSASEDEWTPAKCKDAHSDEDEVSSGDLDEDFAVSPPTKRKRGTTTTAINNKNGGKISRTKKKSQKTTSRMPSLRDKLFKRYNPPPKTITSPRNQSSSSKANKSKQENDSDSDSGSSVENFLVNPDQLDLKSSYFDKHVANAKKQAEEDKKDDEEPNFDCNAGLSDNESEDDDDDMESVNEDDEDYDPEKKTKSDLSPFKQFYEFKNTVDQVKKNVETIKSSEKPKTQDDITSLLALGEASVPIANATKEKISKKPKNKIKNSDSEWEEVEDEDTTIEENIQKINKDDIEITVGLGDQYEKREKKTVDEQAQIMRRLNRVIKENYLAFHKVSLLCHIAHGFYLNRALNNTSLLTAALKLLPSEKSYPDGRTSIKYFEAITKWYRAIMELKSESVYPKLKKCPPLITSLALQIKTKSALCKRDFVLIFIALIRAMGLQCRLVMNLTPLPIKPAQEDLCSLKRKPEEKQSTKRKSDSKSGNKNVKTRKDKEASSKNSKQKIETKKDVSKSKNEKKQETSAHKSNKSEKNDIKTQVKSLKENDNQKPGSTSKLTQEKSEEIKSLSKEKTSVKQKPSESQDKTSVNHKTSESQEKTTVKQKPSELQEKTSVKQKPSESQEKISVKQKPEITKENPKIIITKEVNKNKLESSPVKTRTQRKLQVENDEPKPSSSKATNKKRSPSPKFHISPKFIEGEKGRNLINNSEKNTEKQNNKLRATKSKSRSPSPKFHISPSFCKKTSDLKENPQSTRTKRTLREKLKIPQLDGATDILPSTSKSTKNRSRSNKSLKDKIFAESDTDSDFEGFSPPKKPKIDKPASALLNKVKNRDRRVLSTDIDSEPETKKKKDEKDKDKKSMNLWIELYSEEEDQWVPIDLFKVKVLCVEQLRKGASNPVAYVFAWNNDNSLKDVSPRYCPQWNTVTRKLRVEKEWLDEAIHSYLGKKTSRDVAEDRELEKIHIDKPLPTIISEFKNHPLYALERHLLKFEAIYPPKAPTLGFVRGEPIYPRDCVHTLYSREVWYRAARIVKLNEKPYKVVKARPKWDKFTCTVIKDQPLDIFGYWQTEKYKPPTAENGIVPRNAYGNVELFKACMLPKKTVHLKLPGLNRVCKKLGIDCAQAVIGFDFHQGSCHPEYDGFVVCEEFKDQVIKAWEDDQEEQERKEREKFETRVYGNWKRLIKGLIIRERLKAKYNFGDHIPKEEPPKKTSSKRKQ